MNKLGLLELAAQFAPRLTQARRGTWIALGLGLLALLGFALWLMIALAGWLFGQAPGWLGAARQLAAEPAHAALERVEQAMPGAREKVAAGLGELVPILKPEDRPRRDVSGTDFAPVARYPDLPRTYWQRDGRRVTVQYEGRADYVAVSGHYAQGFDALGYTQDLQSATPETETHVWTKGTQRYLVTIVDKSKGVVFVHLETTLQ